MQINLSLVTHAEIFPHDVNARARDFNCGHDLFLLVIGRNAEPHGRAAHVATNDD